MKKNGFTLVELLAVIVILAFLLLLLVPSIFKTKENALGSLNNLQEKNLKEAAKLLALDIDDYTSDVYNCKSSSWLSGKCSKEWTELTVSVEELIEHGYFQDEQNHCTGTIKINKNGSPYKIELESDVTCR